MKGSKDVARPGWSAAVFQRLVALVTALAVLAPSFACAGTPYRLDWVSTESSASCEAPFLAHNGGTYFHVNDTPLPTYEVPDTLVTHDDGSQSHQAEAEFDSVLLRFGANDFHFGVRNAGGDDWCTDAHELVSLVSEPLGLNKPLFHVRRSGTAFSGATTLDLSLAEVNPALARDIEILLAEIAKERAALVANARAVGLLAEKLDLLQQLDTELKDLVSRPLDEISRTDLAAILDRYKDAVAPETRAAMEQLVDDLKQSVSDLEDELARLMDEFGAQADEFDDGRDPYAAYADAVLAALEADVSGRVVVLRADFVANVRAWRANSAALEIALRDRMGVSLAETNAFLKAQSRITGFVRQFMDASDWFIETPIPPDLRVQVDTVLKPRFDALADQMKDDLNLWTGEGFDLEQTQLYQTISAFAGAMSTVAEGFGAYAEVMQTLVHATTRLGVGFVPVVGPALDLCEAVTGKAWCLPSGQELSDEERIFSGVGFGVAAIGPMWRVIKTASGLRPAAIRVAGEIAEIEEFFAQIVKTNRVRGYKTLPGAITKFEVDIFEKKAAKFLVDDGRSLVGVGDDGVREVVGIPKHSSPGGSEGAAPDFVSISSGHQLIVSEAKGGKIPVSKVRKQLTNAMKALKEKGLDGDVARYELIMEQGAKFDDENVIVRDGYLFNLSTRKRVTLIDSDKIIMVIRL
ncbi:hypothetical protein [Sorangium sp. So ce426]|uniref:hypothetical protein n=1 Tax=Sorangium sp. So ce426 TaxID=3133312 RepID=UPI003F5B4B22